MKPFAPLSLSPIGPLVLRLAAGSMLLVGHGWSKLAGFSENAHSFPDPLGVGAPASLALTIFAEAFCALLVILGLATRLACVPIVFMLLVAGFVVHAPDPWSKKEFAFIYAVPFLALILLGPGKYSLDEWLARRCRSIRTSLSPPGS